MIKFQFFLGTDTNGQAVDGQAIAYKLASQHFPHGHSTHEIQGRWLSEAGPVDEKTVVVTWYAAADLILTGEADKRASAFAGAYKNEAFQESVLIERQEVDAFFV